MAKKNHKKKNHEKRGWDSYVVSGAKTFCEIQIFCSRHLHLEDVPQELRERLIDQATSRFAERLAAELAEAPPNERLRAAKAIFYGILTQYINQCHLAEASV